MERKLLRDQGSARVSRALIGVSPIRPSVRDVLRQLARRALGGTPSAATETVALLVQL